MIYNISSPSVKLPVPGKTSGHSHLSWASNNPVDFVFCGLPLSLMDQDCNHHWTMEIAVIKFHHWIQGWWLCTFLSYFFLSFPFYVFFSFLFLCFHIVRYLTKMATFSNFQDTLFYLCVPKFQSNTSLLHFLRILLFLLCTAIVNQAAFP